MCNFNYFFSVINLEKGAQEPLFLSCLHVPAKLYDTKELVKRYTKKNVTMFAT